MLVTTGQLVSTWASEEYLVAYESHFEVTGKFRKTGFLVLVRFLFLIQKPLAVSLCVACVKLE